MALMKAGDHIVCSDSVFGSTIALLNRYFVKFGVEVTYVRPDDNAAWRDAIRPNTRLLFLETPSNPLSVIADIRAIAAIAHERGVLLAVDNCFCTPALQKPFELGADLVIHSATKFLDGQGRCVGGAVVGDERLVGAEVFGFIRSAGPSMSPFNAWVFLKGLETLDLRMRAHSEAGLELAAWLERQPGVRKVYYAGLESHPQHDLARRQQSGFGGIVAFEVEHGRNGAWAFIDATKLMSITANLGDVKTTITHPASTTHSRITATERERAGITEGLLRISVGLEHPDDLKADLQRGLAAVRGQARLDGAHGVHGD
jgi:O-succinylhomoserine sulfhydrylase